MAKVARTEVVEARHRQRGALKIDPEIDERSCMLAIVDELGTLAADLWFDGRLDGVLIGESTDGHDE